MSRTASAVAAAIALILGLALIAPAVSADALRCGSRLATDGDTLQEVRAKCGEPEKIETRNIMQRPSFWRNGRLYFFGDAVVEVPVELWTYNFGPNKLMHRLKFVDGRLEEVAALGHGHLPQT